MNLRKLEGGEVGYEVKFKVPPFGGGRLDPFWAFFGQKVKYNHILLLGCIIMPKEKLVPHALHMFLGGDFTHIGASKQDFSR